MYLRNEIKSNNNFIILLDKFYLWVYDTNVRSDYKLIYTNLDVEEYVATLK